MRFDLLYHALASAGVVVVVYVLGSHFVTRCSRYHVIWFALGVSTFLGGLKELTDYLKNDWPWCGNSGCQADIWDFFVDVDAAIATVCLLLFCETPSNRQRDNATVVTMGETIVDECASIQSDDTVLAWVKEAHCSEEDKPESVVTKSSSTSCGDSWKYDESSPV